MEFGVLGPLEIVGRAGPAVVRGKKRRALLAYLLVHRGEPVPLDRLVHELWDERPSSGAKGTVQTYLSQLRKLFADREGVTLETHPTGYALMVPPEHVDSTRFEELCVRATAEANVSVRLAILDEALRLWRGAPLAEFAGSAWADVEATRLGALRLEAVHQRLDALLELGHHAGIIPDLEHLVDEEPLDEHFWAQLMLAFYRTGRQADALRTYQRARSTLVDQLGIEPGSALTALERQILDHDPALTVVPAPLGPPPLPARLTTDAVFFGREEERRNLDAALDAVQTETRRRVVLVGGEPGIGKTSLVARFAQPAHEEGAVVLYGHCDEDLRIAYEPWREALGQLVRHAPDFVLGASAGRAPRELARLVPGLAPLAKAPSSVSPDPETERYLLFSAVAEVFVRASSAAPVVLVLEDVHWADTPTLELLRYLVGVEVPLRLLVVVTYRDTDTDDRHQLPATLAALNRDPRVHRLSLDGLDTEAIGALLEAAVGLPLDANGLVLRDALVSETDGNPFFVTELVRDLVEAGTLRPHDGERWTPMPDIAPVLPASVREVITQRVARLSDETRGLLVTASVIGRDFDVGLLADVAETDEAVVLDALDAATSAALVLPIAGEVDRYTFVHALVARALCDGPSPARRRRVHGRIAAQLEHRCGDDPGDQLAELARHWLAAASDPHKAIHYAARAGAHALAQLAPEDGLHWYRRALGVLDRTDSSNDAERGAVLTGLGDAQRQTGDAAYRETLLAAAGLARRLGDTELLARAVVANNRGMLNAVGQADAARLDALEAADVATEGAATPTRALVLATLAAELAFADRARMLRVAHAAIELARRLGDDHALVTVITRLEAAIGSPDTLAERVALADEAIATAERTGDPVLRWYAAAMGYTPALESGDVEAFDQRVDVVGRLARDIGQPFMRWASAIARSVRAQLVGDLERAEELAAEALEIGSTSGQPDAGVFYAGALIGIRLDQGRIGELADLIESAPDAGDIPGTRAVLALCYCESGRLAEAGALLEADASTGFSGFPFDPMWTSFMSVAARVAASLANRRAAAQIADLLEPWRDQIATSGAGVWGGSLEHALGLALTTLGRHDEAEEAFARAAAVHERIEAPILLAQTRVEWARLLVERDPNRSLELARSARTVAKTLGAASIERDAGALQDDLVCNPTL